MVRWRKISKLIIIYCLVFTFNNRWAIFKSATTGNEAEVNVSQILTHRFSNKVYEWKVTPNGHYMLRQIFRDCSGVKPSKWQRVLSATVKQLRNESVEHGRNKVEHKKLIDVAKLGQDKQECSKAWAIGWAVFAAACSVALVYGLVMRGVL